MNTTRTVALLTVQIAEAIHEKTGEHVDPEDLLNPDELAAMAGLEAEDPRYAQLRAAQRARAAAWTTGERAALGRIAIEREDG